MNYLKCLTYTDTIKKILLYTLYLSTFTPLIMSSLLMNQYVDAKFFFFSVLIYFASILYIILIIKKEVFFSFDLISKISTLFLILILISTLLNDRPLVGLLGTLERREGFLFYFTLYVYFLLLKNVLYMLPEHKRFWYIFFYLTITTSTLISIYGLYEYFFLSHTIKSSSVNSIFKIKSTIGNSAILANYLLVSFFITIWATIKSKRKKYFTITTLILASLLQLTCLLLTGSRAGFVGLIFGLCSILYLFLIQNKSVKLKILIFLITGTFSIFLIGSLVFFGHTISKKITPEDTKHYGILRILNFDLQQKTIVSRFELWKIGLKGFIDKPLLGWGSENYKQVYNMYYSQKLSKIERWHDRAHNNYLDILIRFGGIGLSLYILTCIVIFYTLWVRKTFQNTDKIFISSILIAYLFHNIFLFQSITDTILITTIIAYIFSNIKKEPSLYRLNYSTTIAFSTLFIILIMFSIQISEMYVSHLTKKALLNINLDPEYSLILYKKAFKYTPEDSLILPYYLYSTSSILTQTNIEKSTKISYLLYAYEKIIELDSSILKDPQLSMIVSKFFNLIDQQGLKKDYKAGFQS